MRDGPAVLQLDWFRAVLTSICPSSYITKLELHFKARKIGRLAFHMVADLSTSHQSEEHYKALVWRGLDSVKIH